MNDSGYIKLHRKITDWEWYQNTNTVRLFLHLLLMANYTDGRFEGKEIKRGQLVTSLPSLSDQTGLTIQQARTALEHLQSTGEITSKQQARYRVITIVKYDQYQADNRLDNSQTTGYQQADNRLSTGYQQQYKNNKNNKNAIREECKETSPTESQRNATRFSPPTPDDVRTFCQENGLTIDADRFCDYYASRGWKVGSSPMKDWKAAVRYWTRRDASPAPAKPQRVIPANDFEQRDYSGINDEIMSDLAAEMDEFLRGGGIDG